MVETFKIRKAKHFWYYLSTSLMPPFVSQSRICGKGVGLGLFPSVSLESQSYEIDEISHITLLYDVERLYESSFKSLKICLTKSKKAPNWSFF